MYILFSDVQAEVPLVSYVKVGGRVTEKQKKIISFLSCDNIVIYVTSIYTNTLWVIIDVLSSEVRLPNHRI